tara:strand:- start:515 stop:685 length:171 start_codon:yes stop_codon:yes gene_type:complete
MWYSSKIFLVFNTILFLGDLIIKIVIIITENKIETIDKIEKTLFNKSVSVSFIIIE